MKRNALTSKFLAAVGCAAVLASSAFAGETVIVDKNPPPPAPEKWWGANLKFGYDSLYVFRGVSVLGGQANSGIVYTDLNASITAIPNFTLTTGVWFGSGISSNLPLLPGQTYNELDVYVNGTYSIGPVDLSLGYIYYHYPYINYTGFYDTHELVLGAAYTGLPYVTPSMTWYYDMGRFQGWYGEIKIAGAIPVYNDIISLNPYILFGFDLGSVRKLYLEPLVSAGAGSALWNGIDYGFSEVQIGLETPVRLSEVITFTPYVKASFPVYGGRQVNNRYGSPIDKVWAGVSVTFSF